MQETWDIKWTLLIQRSSYFYYFLSPFLLWRLFFCAILTIFVIVFLSKIFFAVLVFFTYFCYKFFLVFKILNLARSIFTKLIKRPSRFYLYFENWSTFLNPYLQGSHVYSSVLAWTTCVFMKQVTCGDHVYFMKQVTCGDHVYSGSKWLPYCSGSCGAPRPPVGAPARRGWLCSLAAGELGATALPACERLGRDGQTSIVSDDRRDDHGRYWDTKNYI
jgi:hypothetical protein